LIVQKACFTHWQQGNEFLGLGWCDGEYHRKESGKRGRRKIGKRRRKRRRR